MGNVRNVGSSVLVALPILGTKSQDVILNLICILEQAKNKTIEVKYFFSVLFFSNQKDPLHINPIIFHYILFCRVKCYCSTRQGLSVLGTNSDNLVTFSKNEHFFAACLTG